MSPRRSRPRGESLERLIRTSPALDEDGKREWLRVLPHLKRSDRQRLRQILAEAKGSLALEGTASPA